MSDLFVIIAGLIPLVPATLGFFLKRKLSLPIKIVWYFSICNASMALIGIVSSYLIIAETFFTIHIYTIVEFGLLALAFQVCLNSTYSRRTYYILMALFIVLVYYEVHYISGWLGSNNYARSFESIILLGIVLFYFFDRIIYHHDTNLKNNPMWWVGIGVLVYFGLNLFIFLLDEKLTKQQLAFFWNYGHNSVYIIRDLLFAFGIWIGRNFL